MSRSTHVRSVTESMRNDQEGGCQSSLPKGPKIELPETALAATSAVSESNLPQSGDRESE
jgi:hypothetical protein